MEEFRDKLSRDTGTSLTAAACEELLGSRFQGEGHEVTLQSHPGLFYPSLGSSIMDGKLPVVRPEHREKVAWWCYREAAEAHNSPQGMHRLGNCYHRGYGVTEDPAQAVAWWGLAENDHHVIGPGG